MTSWLIDASRPPHSRGHPGAAHPAPYIVRCHARRMANASSGSARTSPVWFSASHARNSVRNAASSVESSKSISPSAAVREASRLAGELLYGLDVRSKPDDAPDRFRHSLLSLVVRRARDFDNEAVEPPLVALDGRVPGAIELGECLGDLLRVHEHPPDLHRL